MRYVALFGHGSNWQAGKSVYEQGAPIEDHLAMMRRRFDEGSLLLGGPFVHQRGGIAVLECPDEATAVALMEADPAVIAGVLRYELHPLRAYFDAFTSVRTEATVAALALRAKAG